MVKRFKEYLGVSTIRVSGLDAIQPMSSLSRKGTDIGPKNGRARGLSTLAASTLPKEKKKKKTK